MSEWRPGLDTDWDSIAKLLTHLTRHDCHPGISQLQKFWQRKQEVLGRYFAPDGRLIIPLQEMESISWPEIRLSVQQPLQPLAQKLAQKKRFSHFGRNAAAFAEWLVNRLRSWDVQAVANNRVIQNKQEVCVSKLLSQEIREFQMDRYHRPYLNAPWPFSNYTETDKPLMLEFVQILFSRVVELLMPLITDAKRPTLVISINPLDIITCGFHTTGWSSCFNCASSDRPLGYVGDEHTIIAFTFRETPELPGAMRPYPRKIWRHLIFVDLPNRSAIGTAQFPAAQDLLVGKVQNAVALILGEHAGFEPKFTIDTSAPPNNYYSHVHQLYSTLVHAWPGYIDGVHYILKLQNETRAPNLVIGSDQVPCLSCGRMRSDGLHFRCTHCRTLKNQAVGY